MVGMKLDVPGQSDDLRKRYEAINDEIGTLVDFTTNGIISHTAGPIPSGWRVVDIWQSREKLDQFLAKLMPVIQKHGLPAAPPEFWEIENTTPGKKKG